MASLALKINWKAHPNGTVTAVLAAGTDIERTIYAGEISMPGEAFKFFRETLTIGAMALNGVTELEINEVITDENNQL